MNASTPGSRRLVPTFAVGGIIVLASLTCNLLNLGTRPDEVSSDNQSETRTALGKPSLPQSLSKESGNAGDAGAEIQYDMIRFMQSPRRVSVESARPFHEAKLRALVSPTGYLILPVKVSGKQALFVFDTGACFTSWPRNFDFEHVPTGLRQRVFEVVQRTPWDAALVHLKDVQIGDLRVRDLPSNRIASDEPPPDSEWAINFGRNSAMGTTPILGYSVFENQVLTVDYRRKQLVVRDHDFDVTVAVHLRANASLLDLTRRYPFDIDETGREWGGYLTVTGTLNGKPCRFLLDSGWPADEVALTHSYARSVGGQFRDAAGGSGTAVWNLGSVRQRSVIKLLHKDFALDRDVDAVVGFALLSRCAVTIDCLRGKVMLEPFDGTRTEAVLATTDPHK